MRDQNHLPRLLGLANAVRQHSKYAVVVRIIYIHVMWPKLEALQMPAAQERSRQIIGWVGLAAFVALFGALAVTQTVERKGRT
ncbi:hypothetical protein ILFOPFJJ_05869 [Ensifer psoraleae]|uniref:hypothetical protein n=1 Tax=Sinorhizobium psoraleae TaxID=520838 RepID=UPI0015688E85|nr:hypothetical protein [Sinorhizobium psoraleae]NRP74946.1 hypothetical protein [Sinorhizobium psoraleae]